MKIKQTYMVAYAKGDRTPENITVAIVDGGTDWDGNIDKLCTIHNDKIGCFKLGEYPLPENSGNGSSYYVHKRSIIALVDNLSAVESIMARVAECKKVISETRTQFLDSIEETLV